MTPQTKAEICVAIVCILFAGFFWAWVLGSMCNILTTAFEEVPGDGRAGKA